MSLRIYKHLVCDRCGKQSDPIDKKCKHEEARTFFPKWHRFLATHDYCPKCWPAIKKQFPALAANEEATP